MKSSKIDRILSVVVIGTCLVKAVLYGGSKPPSSTNEPPSGVSGEVSTNSVPDDLPGPTGVSPVGSSLLMMRVAGHECSGVFFIDPPPPNDDDPPHHQCCNACCGDACRCDGTCCLCNCGCHSSSNSNTNAPPDSATP